MTVATVVLVLVVGFIFVVSTAIILAAISGQDCDDPECDICKEARTE